MATRGERYGPLRDFLVRSFDRREFDMILRTRGYERIALAVDRDVATYGYFFGVVAEMDRWGLINAAFFQLLREERRNKSAKIDGLERAWLSEDRIGEEPSVGMTSISAPEEAPDGLATSRRLTFTNQSWRRAILIGAVLVLASMWLSFYTPYREFIASEAGVLAAGGIVSCLALALTFMPEDRRKTIWHWSFYFLFEWRHAEIFWSGLLGIGLVVASCLCTIQIENLQPREGVDVWVYNSGGGARRDEARMVPPGGRIRWVAPSWPLSRSSWEVQVGGYPVKSVTARPWLRKDLEVPYSFLRPVVLVGAIGILVKQAQYKKDLKLQIAINGRALAPLKFDGHPVWIGGQGLEVPQHVRSDWAEDLKDPFVASFLLRPGSLPRAVTLKEGDRVEASLIRPGGEPWARVRSLVVRTPQRPHDIVQPLQLNLDR